MSNTFKKFIDTSGKTIEEIKAIINKMVNNAIESTVDNITQLAPHESHDHIKRAENQTDEVRSKLRYNYTNPEKIPRRPNTPDKAQPRHIHKPNRIYYPHESVSDNLSPQDEYMLDKISQMRDLEIITDNSYLTTLCALDDLINQGEFMHDVEDDYEHDVFCGLQKPIHAMMSVSQLRTFFTWRTDARRGVYRETDKTYVMLYCFEIINKIETSSSEDSFKKLKEVYENCTGFAPSLKGVISRWIKDFYAYNTISSPLPEFENGILTYSQEIQDIIQGCYNDKFSYLASNSSYNVKDSIFLNEETKCMMNESCKCVLEALSVYFKQYGVNLPDLICGKMKKDFSWVPFKGALVDLNRMDGFHSVIINVTECYSIKRGKPMHEFFEFTPSRGFIGYILKSIESRLRKNTGFKNSLKPSITYVENEFKNRSKLMEAISSEEFPAVIKQAVDTYCKENGIISNRTQDKKNGAKGNKVLVPKKIDIDISKLDKIRELADENARKLIIDDELTDHDNLEDHENFYVHDNSETYKVEKLSKKITDEDFNEQINNFLESSDSSTKQIPALNNLPDAWRQFALTLNSDHICYLRFMLYGSEEEYRKRHIMPELMIEDINNIALYNLDDVVIENNDIVDDYVKYITEICDYFKKDCT